ncbi:MAG: hypothetical protein AB7S86_07810 [Hydrogenophaga sp.]|uniref:hypothetical protein n=1 Tax=Hydrogenophaga sp. TaxID=1904254 RepID=UPI003D0B4D13
MDKLRALFNLAESQASPIILDLDGLLARNLNPNGRIDSAGMGNVPSLHQAMARDASGVLQDLAEQWINASPAGRAGLLGTIIDRWAGAEDVEAGPSLFMPQCVRPVACFRRSATRKIARQIHSGSMNRLLRLKSNQLVT